MRDDRDLASLREQAVELVKRYITEPALLKDPALESELNAAFLIEYLKEGRNE